MTLRLALAALLLALLPLASAGVPDAAVLLVEGRAELGGAQPTRFFANLTFVADPAGDYVLRLTILGQTFSGRGRPVPGGDGALRFDVALTSEGSPAELEERRGLAGCLSAEQVQQGQHQPNGVCFEFTPDRLRLSLRSGELRGLVTGAPDAGRALLRGKLSRLDTDHASAETWARLSAELGPAFGGGVPRPGAAQARKRLRIEAQELERRLKSEEGSPALRAALERKLAEVRAELKG